MRIWEQLLRVVGAMSMALSIWGFYLLIDGLQQQLRHPVSIPQAPLFRHFFFAMNAVDLVLLLAMVLVAVGLLSARRRSVALYTWLYGVLVLYTFAPGLLWGTSLGTSVAAASGLGDMGLSPLLFVPAPFVYPIITVVLVNVAAHRLAYDRVPGESGPR